MSAASEGLTHIIEAPVDRCVAVRAGPGAGKTYLIAQRIAHLIKQGLPRNSRIASITYTNAGIEELERELIPSYFPSRPRQLFLGTIHSFLIEHVLGPYGHFLAEVPKDFKITPPDGFADRFCPRWMAKNLPAHRVSVFESVDYKLDGRLICHRDSAGWKPSAGQMKAFKEAMHQQGYVDLYDVLYLSWRILREFPFIAECLSARFCSILVDEFQDTTLVQNAVLECLQETGWTSLFLVGDPDQSIFSFAGAVPATFHRHLRSARFHCPACGTSEHTLTTNRRSSKRIIAFLGKLSTMSTPQTAVAEWSDYQEPVRLLVGGHQSSHPDGDRRFRRRALRYFFELLDTNDIHVDSDEAFCVLAYQNRDVAVLRALHGRDGADGASALDRLSKVNPRLCRILDDVFVAVKHRQAREWAEAYEAAERALGRLLYDTAIPLFFAFGDEFVGVDRRAWPGVVWTVMEELGVEESQSLLDLCRNLKDLVDRAVSDAGGKSVRRSKLGVLDCRSRARSIAQSCSAGSQLRAVIRPSLVGDNFRTIHKAKGIQRDTVLVFARDPDELDSWILFPDMQDDESSRRGYVAFSRARRILCIACAGVNQGRLEQLSTMRHLRVVTLTPDTAHDQTHAS